MVKKLSKEVKQYMERELRQYYYNKKKLKKLREETTSTRKLIYLEERLYYVENVYKRLKPFEQEIYDFIFKEGYNAKYCETQKGVSKTTYYNILNKSLCYLAEEYGEI